MENANSFYLGDRRVITPLDNLYADYLKDSERCENHGPNSLSTARKYPKIKSLVIDVHNTNRVRQAIMQLTIASPGVLSG